MYNIYEITNDIATQYDGTQGSIGDTYSNYRSNNSNTKIPINP